MTGPRKTRARTRVADGAPILVPLDLPRAARSEAQCIWRRMPPAARGALLLGYAAFEKREIRAGVRKLAGVMTRR